MSDTAHAEPQQQEQEKDTGFDQFADDFFKEKPDAQATTPPAESAAPPAPAAEVTPAATPAPETPAKRVVKWKDEEGEHDFDIDEHYSDEAKRGRLRELIEKGNAFERVVPRRQAEAVRTAFQELQQHARNSGYDLRWNAQLGKAEIVPLQTPATAQKQETTKPPADVAMLREKRKALEARVAEGDSDAIVEDYKLQGQIHEAELTEVRRQAAEIAEWRKAQEAQAEASQRTQFQRDLIDFSARYRERRKGAFHGMNDAEYDSLVKGFVPLAQTWEQLTAHLDAYANRIEAAVAERVKEITKGSAAPVSRPAGPAPSAPPPMGGSPPASGGAGKDRSKLAASSKGFEADVDDWFGRTA